MKVIYSLYPLLPTACFKLIPNAKPHFRLKAVAKGAVSQKERIMSQASLKELPGIISAMRLQEVLVSVF